MNELNELYTVHVNITIDEMPFDVEEDRLRAAVSHALQAGGQKVPCALTLQLADDEEIRRLNRQFAGIDSVTDVLSFPAEDEPYATEPDEPPYLGDVIIAVPVAKTQAAATGHSLMVELQMLAIHGTLHLLGYDHHTPQGQAEMQACEAAALRALQGGGLW
jgi:probable rRNA maturation factor